MALADHPEATPPNEPTLFDDLSDLEKPPVDENNILIPEISEGPTNSGELVTQEVSAIENDSATAVARKKFSPFQKTIAAVALLATGVVGGLQLKEDDATYVVVPVQQTETTKLTVPETTTTLESLVITNQDFRPKNKQTFEFTPVYGVGTTAQEVIDQIYANWEFAHEQREPRYLAYFLDKMDGEYARGLKNSINNLQNYYDVNVTVKVVPGTEVKTADSWSMRITRDIDVPKLNEYEEPHTRQLKLVIKEFLVPDNSSDGYAEKPSWVVTNDYPVDQ